MKQTYPIQIRHTSGRPLKHFIFFYLFLTAIICKPGFTIAQVNTQDSLALVDLYNKAGGAGWVSKTNWLTTAPVSTWSGVSVQSGRVTQLNLSFNNLAGTISPQLGNLANLAGLNLYFNQLTGSIPAELGNLVNLANVDLSFNSLTGNIPSSLGNLTNLQNLYLSYNQLSGSIPSSLSNLTKISFFEIDNNQFTFAGLEGIVSKFAGTFAFLSYSPQANIPIISNGNNLSVAAGGTLANNTYSLYRNDTLMTSQAGDSVFTITAAANYYISVTNAIATALTLKSVVLKPSTNIQDSLALVALYDSTNGVAWANQANWLTIAPLSTWYGVTMQLGRVVQLNLAGNNLTGGIPVQLGNLTNLQQLNFGNNNLGGTIPASLQGLTNLTNLDLHNNKFTFAGMEGIATKFAGIQLSYSPQAIIPLIKNGSTLSVSAGGTPSNDTFRLYRNDTMITKQAGDSIFTMGASANYYITITNSKARNLTLTSDLVQATTYPQDSLALVALYNSAGGNNWYFKTNWLTTAPLNTWFGVTMQYGRVTQLNLAFNNVTGSLPTQLGNLISLQLLYLYSNGLSGSIPSSLCSLSKLQYLYLYNNQLSGSLPSTLGGLTHLVSLDVSHNQLTGILPSNIGNLVKLTSLTLSFNKLSGSIPSSLLNLTNLATIALDNNKFTFAGMEGVAAAFAARQLTYSPQATIPIVKNGSLLSVSAGGTPANDTFRLYRNDTLLAKQAGDSVFTTTTAADYFITVTNTVATKLALNSDTSKAVTNSQDSLALVTLFDSTGGSGWFNKTNWLTAAPLNTWFGVSMQFGRVTQLNLGVNNLIGNMPTQLGSLAGLQQLNLYSNQLGGSIPSSFGNLTNLLLLNLYNNQLSGGIPTSLGNLIKLQQLNLYNNQLSGILPSSLGSLSSLTNLYLYNNQLTGSIPATLGNLVKLVNLSLRNNQLTGSIPAQINNLTNLYYFDVSYNKLSGGIPSMANLANLEYLYLNNNQFTYAGMEAVVTKFGSRVLAYAPQAAIPYIKNGSNISVAAGGTLANNTYTLYRNDTLITKQAGDSVFAMGPVADYYITITSSVAKLLALNTDTLKAATNKQDSLAMVALYDSTKGSGWTNKTNWLTTAPLSTWYGVTMQFGRIIQLSLPGNNLTGTIPSQLGNATSLNILDLSNNKLEGSIPTQLGALVNLKQLLLSINQLGGSIPSSITNLVNLQTLELENNQFTFAGLEAVATKFANIFLFYWPQAAIPLIKSGTTLSVAAGGTTANNTYSLYRNDTLLTKQVGNAVFTASIPADYYITVTNAIVKNLTLNSITLKAPLNTADSLALVDLYNSTNGPGWFTKTNWLTAAPLGTWTGIIVKYGRVTQVNLGANNLTGNLPASLGNLSGLQILGLINNNLTFAGMEGLVTRFANILIFSYNSQQLIPFARNGNTISVSAGGTPANNTYNLYRNDTLVKTQVGDSVFNAGTTANYFITVTNAVATKLTLYSNTLYPLTNIQDSLALVALYNSTNGAGWVNHTNWLTSAPLSTWFGLYDPYGRVTELNLSGNNLTGTIPTQLGNLTQLTYLNLYNNKLSGSIPAQLGNLINLQVFSLSYNQLSGNIPTQFGNLINLKQLILINNHLTGGIPVQFGNLANITDLELGNNQLTGSIPAQLGNLTKLTDLYLSYCRLNGAIPSSLGSLVNLTDLEMTQNQLTGNIPSSLGNLVNLTTLNLSQNGLEDSIPSSLGNITKLTTLDVSSNQLSGIIPSSFAKLPNLSFWLYNNNFTFTALEKLPAVKSVSYSPQAAIPYIKNGNNVSVDAGGTLANNTYTLYRNDTLVTKQVGDSIFTIGTTGDYFVSVTNAIGTQLTLYSDTLFTQPTNGPDSLALVALYDSTNGPGWTKHTNWLTTAPIHDWYGVVVLGGRVIQLNLGSNNLAGTVITQLGSLTGLKVLDLSGNKLSGNLPLQLGNLTNLQALILTGNKLNSTIPSQLGSLTNLIALFLSANQLHGSIPTSLGSLANLQILDLSSNQLSGAIPSTLGSLTNLQLLTLSNNKLSSAIPSQLGNLANLTGLYLDNNKLSGPIPSQLGNLTQLQYFYLNNNQFTFAGMGGITAKFYGIQFIYSPQAAVPLIRKGDTLSIPAGGAPSYNTYKLYENGVLNSIQIDSVFIISDTASYFITATDIIANQLTLTSDTLNEPASAQDSLALVALYNSTAGSNWLNKTRWLTTSPLFTWYGVTVANGRVTQLNLAGNNLKGSIPASMANLGNLATLNLNNNQLTFAGMEGVATKFANIQLQYSPQAIIPLIENGNTLAASAGGTLANDTFSLYRNDTLVTKQAGDSVFTMDATADYFITVTNAIATQLTLKTDTLKLPANSQDSLVLVALYNSTQGAGWYNNTNWLTTAPLSNWYGVTVLAGRVTQLSLAGNNLTGTIIIQLGSLTNLVWLDLSFNNLSGSLPLQLDSLVNLQSLSLSHNQLTGNIPIQLGSLANLQKFIAGYNQLSGSIPTQLGNLLKLTTLDLSNNKLTGAIPGQLSKPANLQYLNVSNNQLSGGIPSSLGSLVKLYRLYLNNNQLSGSIPSPLGTPVNLNTLDISFNQLSGSIPASLGNLVKLSTLNLSSNQFTFAGMEGIVTNFFNSGTYLSYSPQATIPVIKNGNFISVSPGGTLANDTFRLYKNNTLQTAQMADSGFTITAGAQYYITVTNGVAKQLTLYSTLISDLINEGKYTAAPVALQAVLYPNPSVNDASLQITGNTNDRVLVTIADVTGRQLWQRITPVNTTIILPSGSYAAGVFFVTVSNGKQSKTLKLIKTGK